MVYAIKYYDIVHEIIHELLYMILYIHVKSRKAK